MKPIAHLDIKQHLSEWVRYVIPIGVVVTAIMIISWAMMRDASNVVIDDAVAKAAPNGLVPVGLEGPIDPAFFVLSPIEMVSSPLAVRWDAPLGTEHGAMAYNAQPFLTDKHLGDDLNGIGGWNSDLGDPVYAAANGRVVFSGWPSDGWGNVVILSHELPDGRLVETFYGHLDTIKVAMGKQILRGTEIGTVGTAAGNYLAHLHFEIRQGHTIDVGGGYAETGLDRLSGELSLLKWRGREDDQLSGPPVAGIKEEVSIGVETAEDP